MKNRTHFFLGSFLLLWSLAVFYSIKILIDYSKDPGPSGEISSSWPSDSRVVRIQGHPTLVMSAHSMCSCTRASIEELSKIMTSVEDKLTVAVLLIPVEGQSDEEVRETYIWKRGSETHGVTLYIDRDGEETRRFGSLVSGNVILYDASGSLVFHGGITPARGHEGDNAGRDQIVSWVRREDDRSTMTLKNTPVFGCNLFDKTHHME